MKTNKELLIQLLSETNNEDIGLTTIKVESVIRSMERSSPGSTRGFYKEFNQEEVESVLKGMRLQQTLIADWIDWQLNRMLPPSLG